MAQDSLIRRKQAAIAVLALVAIAVHLVLRFGTTASPTVQNVPLWIALALGGVPLVWELLVKLVHREFGSDLLAGISIVTSVLLGEYLAGTLVVLMLSGGEALEAYAVRSASSVLEALAKRMPSLAHRKQDSTIADVPLADVAVGDVVLVFPHEICPIDGTVVEGHGVMDESYLTGEPYMMSKTPGSTVLSGAINGESALTIRADKLAVDSRYAKIMQVMQASQQQRPRMRRLGDQLGAFYTPVAVAIGIAAWVASGDAVRFLAVLVVATPCPLLIAIPVAIIGSISLAARRAIIIRDPAVLETVSTCRTIIFDKTGTLTYGEPELIEQIVGAGVERRRRCSRSWPASSSTRSIRWPRRSSAPAASRGPCFTKCAQISEPPGQGLRGTVAGREVRLTSRKQLVEGTARRRPTQLPPPAGGLECVVLIDDRYAATYRFRDAPRREGAAVHSPSRAAAPHRPRACSSRAIASGGRLPGRAGRHPRSARRQESRKKSSTSCAAETAQANTIFVGDGINDAPALMAATVGIAFGQNSDVTTEAADVVVMDSSLAKVDEFMHISRRMRRIALQSAVGGMAVSVVGMLFAAAGYLPPVAGAIAQEVIDVVAVLNALRVAIRPKDLTDF